MIDNFALWWRGRSTREQRLLWVMGALVALLFLWLVVIRPLGDALDRARQRHGAAVVALAEAQARRAPAGGVSATATPPLPLDAFVTRGAADAGFAATRVTARGPSRVSLTIDAARPQALLGWIARLEAQGVAVETLRARANADRTIAVEAALRARNAS